jgi:hypothetical protein
VTRRGIAGAAAGLLLALILLGQSWTELPRRGRSLVAFAPRELAVRHLGGSGAAFDRRYFSFLENARRRIPPDAPGVALIVPSDDPSYLYLGAYWLSPLPVVGARLLSQHGPARGWITAAYGMVPPEGADGVLARLPEGVLLGPASGEPQPKRVDTP